MISSIGAIGASFIQGVGSLTQAPSQIVGQTSNGGSFTEALGQVVKDGLNTIQNGEAAAIQGVNGSMPTFKVVEQVMSAQRTLQQGLAIRDKAISAYQEIAKMTV